MELFERRLAMPLATTGRGARDHEDRLRREARQVREAREARAAARPATHHAREAWTPRWLTARAADRS